MSTLDQNRVSTLQPRADIIANGTPRRRDGRMIFEDPDRWPAPPRADQRKLRRQG